jgi:hypothetical protein
MRGLQRFPGLFEARMRDNVLSGLLKRALERLEQRGIIVHDQDFLAVLGFAHRLIRHVARARV